MRFLVSAITLGSLCTASPALAEQGGVALRTTITELSRSVTPATATATYAVTVLPAGGAARGTVLRLRTAAGTTWTGRPAICRTAERGSSLVCPLGDLTDPATLRIGVSAPARLNAATSLAVIAAAEATKVSPRPTHPVTPSPPGKPAPVREPTRPPQVEKLPQPRPTAGPALPVPVPAQPSALPPAVPLLPSPSAPVPQLAVPGIPPGPQAQLISAGEQGAVLSDPRTWMSAVGLLLGAEALLLWIWMVFFMRRSLSASKSSRDVWR